MNQIEHIKLANKDPSIEAIYSKRAQFIENIYNKNLRPLIETQDTQIIDNPQANNFNLRQASAVRPESIISKHSIVQNENSFALNRERTDMSLASTALNEAKFDGYSHLGKNDYISDGGVKIYEDICMDLKLVPCSIIVKSLPTAVISLNNYGLGSAGTLALSEALKTNLSIVKLDLSGNSIGASGMKHLARMFEENSTINDLNLSKNGIGSKGVKHLVELFKKNRFLRDLDLSKNDFTDDDAITLAEALEDQQLVRINLSYNGFSEKAGIALGKWIADNTTLIELDLSWNHIRKKGAIQVAKGISENNKLTKVNLSWNGFENEGAEALGKALAHNVILQELHVKCNRIGPPGFAKLCAMLKDNTTLKKLYIGKNHINDEAIDAVLKFFLTQSPLTLELLDVSEVTLKPTIDERIKEVKAVHPKFECLHGFLNFGERKIYNPSEEALNYINMYCADNNISLMDLFAKLDSDGSMSVSYDEFKEGLRRARVPITPLQIEALIKYLDKDGDGEIDFSELVIGDEQARLKKQQNNEQ